MSYDRMQDMVKEYSIFSIKALLVLTSGALLSIGAAYIDKITVDTNIDNLDKIL